MFAFTCVKANGTHLGTCIDRFYFGSCCKLNEETDVYPQDNTIEEGPASGPFVTTDSSIESNDIPDYFTRPKPILDKQPSSSTLSTISQTALVTTQSVESETTTESNKIVTKRPYFSTPYTTTQPPIGLSTFQTLHNYSQGSSNAYTTHSAPQSSGSSSVKPQKPSSTESTTLFTTNPAGSKPRPTSSVSSGTRRPVTTETITKKPSSTSATRPSVTRKPIASSTQRPVSSTEREPPSTRFPPRNATTTRPVQTTTRKPATKKPVPTTKRPSSATRRPVTTSRPSSVAASTAKPSTATEKPFSTSVKVTQTTRPPLTSTQASSSTSAAKPSSSSIAGSPTESATSQRPVTKRPAVTSADDKIVTTVRTTTSRPSTSSPRPRPSSKPTKTSTVSSARPTTTRLPSRPQQQSTEKIKPSTSTTSSSSFARPSTAKPTPASAKPRPTPRPTKPTKPSRPTKPTKPSTIATVSTSISSGTPSTTQPTTFSVTSIVLNGTTLTNEILPPKTSETVATTEKVTQTTHSPGIVTWSSNSDDDVTKPSEISSITPATTQEASTEPQWSPIVTPDGWIMIQSVATEKPVIGDETTTRPKPTKVPMTSVKPTSESATTQSTPTAGPTIPTILSTIATVTTATDLPVPMETLNMSDYKQVCGRRLFPESRIVGGDDSSFGKWPWQISLRQWRSKSYLHKCGAALLNENWAITAAHCVENVPPSDLLLRLGEHDLANENEPYGFQERRVQIVASHPQFDPRTFEYDLALLRFYEPLEPFQPNLLPICLPDDDENYVGHTAYVTGWGRLYEDGILPSVLQEVSVPVINNTMCEGMYRSAGYIEHIPHIFICAGWRKGGYDSCEGDSGGPMVIQRPRDKRWILAGVISWGIGCAEPNQPGVYTRISEFREWINQILQF